jgi:hypothetical protein
VPASLATRLAEGGIPRGLIGLEYRALPEATLVAGTAVGDLVAVGSSGLSGRVCIEVATGSVVHVPVVGGPQVNRVNVNLDSFLSCVAAIIDRFPFYSEDDEPEQFEVAAEGVRQIVSSIDESALDHNGFWVTFIDDVAIGDYATEMIVSARR